MTVTIPRNHTRKITQLKAALTAARVYTLGNDFNGQPVEPAHAWANLDRYPHAKLTDNGGGRYHITLNSNCWYELWAAEHPVTITRDGKPVATVEDSDAAFRWFLRHTNQSSDWMIRYEGYAVVDEHGHELPEFHKG